MAGSAGRRHVMGQRRDWRHSSTMSSPANSSRTAASPSAAGVTRSRTRLTTAGTSSAGALCGSESESHAEELLASLAAASPSALHGAVGVGREAGVPWQGASHGCRPWRLVVVVVFLSARFGTEGLKLRGLKRSRGASLAFKQKERFCWVGTALTPRGEGAYKAVRAWSASCAAGGACVCACACGCASAGGVGRDGSDACGLHAAWPTAGTVAVGGQIRPLEACS